MLDTAKQPDEATVAPPRGRPSTTILDRVRRHFFLVVTIVLVGGFLAHEWSRMFFAYSSDAYVDVDVVTVAPVVAGPIATLKVADNDVVEKGDVLFELDLRPFHYDVELKTAALDLARAENKRAADAVAEAQADLSAAEAALKDAQATQVRIQDLVSKGFATQQRLDDVNKTVTTAEADRDKARAAITVAQDALQTSAAQIASATADLALAKYRLERATVYATEGGQIAPFSTVAGDYVDVGEPVMAIVTDNDWRIVVNLPEQNLAFTDVGQTAYFMLSSHPWRIFEGRVRSVTRGISRSAVEERALPYVAPETEWIRLSRRFPVEIDVSGLPADVTLYRGADARVLILH